MFGVEAGIKIIRSNGLSQDDCYLENCNVVREASAPNAASNMLWTSAIQFSEVLTGRAALHLKVIETIGHELVQGVVK